MDEIRQYLDTLGLKPDATPNQAKQAYRDLLMVWHPDRFPEDSRLQQLAQEKTKQINLAYQRLKTRLPLKEPQTAYTKRASGNTRGTGRQNASGTPPNFGSQQEHFRQSGRTKTTTAQSGRSTATRGRIPISVGILFMFLGGVGGAFLFSYDYAGVEVWKVVLVESLIG